MKLPFAGDQPGRCLLAFFLAAGGPLLEPPLLARRRVSCCSSNWLRIASNSFSARPARRWPGDIARPTWCGCGPTTRVSAAGGAAPESCTQSSSVARRISSVSRCMRPSSARSSFSAARQLIHVVGAPLHRLAFLLQVGHRLLMFGGHLLAHRGGFFGQRLPLPAELLAEVLAFRPGPRPAVPRLRQVVSCVPPVPRPRGATPDLAVRRRRRSFLLGRLRRGQPRQPLGSPAALRAGSAPPGQFFLAFGQLFAAGSQFSVAFAEPEADGPLLRLQLGRSGRSVRPRDSPAPSAGCEDGRPVDRPGGESVRRPVRPLLIRPAALAGPPATPRPGSRLHGDNRFAVWRSDRSSPGRLHSPTLRLPRDRRFRLGHVSRT